MGLDPSTVINGRTDYGLSDLYRITVDAQGLGMKKRLGQDFTMMCFGNVRLSGVEIVFLQKAALEDLNFVVWLFFPLVFLV